MKLLRGLGFAAMVIAGLALVLVGFTIASVIHDFFIGVVAYGLLSLAGMLQ
jgi:uncharacterized membrane protein YccC